MYFYLVIILWVWVFYEVIFIVLKILRVNDIIVLVGFMVEFFLNNDF